ncbi:hypothetical protein HYV74_04020 [Candidatus Uhrbacteria bacterium]|nr:hypothetical protein [Candidatus Uhrbacteria bacterium]
MASTETKMQSFADLGRTAQKWILTQVEHDLGYWITNEAGVHCSAIHIVSWVGLVVSITACAFTFWGLLPVGIFGISILASVAVDRAKTIAHRLRDVYPSELHMVCAFLRARVDTTEQEIIGAESPITQLTQHLERLQGEARSTAAQIEKRIGNPSPSGILQPDDLRMSQETVTLLTRDLDRMRKHVDDLRAFFVRARQQVDDLLNPESELSLKRKVTELHAAAQQAGHRVDLVLTQSTVGIHAALERMQEDLRTLIADTGVAAAAALPATGNAAADIEAVERVVTTYLTQAHALDLSIPSTTTTGGAAC